MAIEINWSENMLRGIREDDKTDSKIATRVAERLIAKGFALAHYTEEAGFREGFNWGRSSHGVTTRRIWVIFFEDESGAEFSVTICLSRVSYTRRNPYDRVPANDGKETFSIQATDDVKTTLGWQRAA